MQSVHTVISIGLSPKTNCAPTSSDTFRAARNCIIDIFSIKTSSITKSYTNIEKSLKLPHLQKGGQYLKISLMKKQPGVISMLKQFDHLIFRS